MNFTDGVKVVTSIAAIIGIAFGTVKYFNTTAEKAVAPIDAKIVKLEKRVSKNELNDLLKEALDELYYWRKMKRRYPDDPEVDDKLKEAEDNVKDIKGKIKELEDGE